MADSTNTTMQVLHFIDAKVDSAMPAIRAGVKGAVDATEKYGTSWAKFRAWEYAANGFGFLLLTIFSFVLFWIAYKIFKSVTKKGAWDWHEGNEETPRTAFVSIISIIALVLFITGMVNVFNTLPRGIAAIAEPQGFAVQMLIEGIKDVKGSN